MAIYQTLALLLFLIVAAALLIRYVNVTVDKEFRNLAQAASDPEYRGEELKRMDNMLAGCLPVPSDIQPVAGPASTLRMALPPILLAVGVILLWGGVFAREEKTLWFYSGLAATLLSALFMLLAVGRRKWERLARRLRFRADLRRLNGDLPGSTADLRELLKLTPRDDAAWAELSDDLAAGGDLEQALDAICQAVRLDPRYSEYRMIEASLAIRTHRLDQARDAIKAWTAMDGVDSGDPRLVIYQAALELAKGDRERAEASLKTVLLDSDGQSFEFLDNDQALADVRNLLPGRGN